MNNNKELNIEIIEAEVTEVSEDRIVEISRFLKAEINQLQSEYEKKNKALKQEADVLRQNNFQLRNKLQNLSEDFYGVTQSSQNLQHLLTQLKSHKSELEKQIRQGEWRIHIHSQNAAKAIEVKNKDLATKEIMRETIQKNLVKVLKSQLEQQNQIFEILQSSLQTLENFIKKM